MTNSTSSHLLILVIACGAPLLVAAEPDSKGDGKLLQRDAPLDVLIEALRSEDFSTSIRAVDFIGERGEEASEAVPALVEALDTRHQRESALHALKKIGPGASAAIPALYNSLTAYPKQPATRWIATIPPTKW